MAIHNTPVTLEELAAAIGRTEDYLKRNWKKLHQKHGLPLKLSIGWIWPRLAVEAYLKGLAEIEDGPEPIVPVSVIAANQNAALAARYVGGTA